MVKTKPVVFVVDDDDSVRKALKRLITSAGLDTETFSSAQDFLNRGHRDVPGCLILDVRMPGVSGIELQAQLAAAGSNMPIIFITAHEGSQLRQQAMKAGAVAFLQKPFDDQRLLDAIWLALDRDAREKQNDGTL